MSSEHHKREGRRDREEMLKLVEQVEIREFEPKDFHNGFRRSNEKSRIRPRY